MGAAVVLIPVAGLLCDGLTRLVQKDLAPRLVLDCSTERTNRVDVFNLTTRVEVGTRLTNRDVGIDAHRSFFHLRIGSTNGDEDAAQLGHICLGLLGMPDVRATDDFDQWNTGTVEVDQ